VGVWECVGGLFDDEHLVAVDLRHGCFCSSFSIRDRYLFTRWCKVVSFWFVVKPDGDWHIIKRHDILDNIDIRAAFCHELQEVDNCAAGLSHDGHFHCAWSVRFDERVGHEQVDTVLHKHPVRQVAMHAECVEDGEGHSNNSFALNSGGVAGFMAIHSGCVLAANSSHCMET
jgi:hypothetical protein